MFGYISNLARVVGSLSFFRRADTGRTRFKRTPWTRLKTHRAGAVSVSVRKGTTFSGQWGPPERLRRDPFDHAQGSSQLAGLARARSVAAGRSDRWTEAQAVSR